MCAKIACDIDDTLYPFGNAVRDEFFRMAEEYDDKSILKAAYAPHVEWRSLSDSLPDSDLVYEAILRVHNKTIEQVPFDYCVKTLWELINSGHEIIYITSRKDKYHEPTEQWLNEWEFPTPSNLICVQDSKIPHIRDCKYLIDDRPQTVLDFVTDYTWKRWTAGHSVEGRDRKAFGLWLPYNQALTDVKNVYLAPGWFGINFYLQRKNIITV